MMKNSLFLISLMFLISSCATSVKLVPETVSFTRYLVTMNCTLKKEGNDCIGPVVHDLEKSQVSLKLEHFGKGKGKPGGLVGMHEFKFEEDGQTYTGAIRVIKQILAGSRTPAYTVTVMWDETPLKTTTLRTRFSSWSQFNEITMVGSRKMVKKNAIYPELVVGPPLKLSN